MEFLKVILMSVALVAIAMFGLAIRILLKKGGKFPNTHVSGNKYLKKQGVYCSQTQDKIEQAKVKKNINYQDVKLLNTTKTG